MLAAASIMMLAGGCELNLCEAIAHRDLLLGGQEIGVWCFAGPNEDVESKQANVLAPRGCAKSNSSPNFGIGARIRFQSSN